YLGMLMTKDHRSPGTDVVDVFVPLDVHQHCPVGLSNDDGMAADRAERPCWAIHSAGYRPASPLELPFARWPTGYHAPVLLHHYSPCLPTGLAPHKITSMKA